METFKGNYTIVAYFTRLLKISFVTENFQVCLKLQSIKYIICLICHMDATNEKCKQIQRWDTT